MSRQNKIQNAAHLAPNGAVYHRGQRQFAIEKHACVQCEAASSIPSQASVSPVRGALDSPSQPIDTRTRSTMETHFGFDFSGVRVHTDTKAAESAEALKANAYTSGRHIVFNSQRYAPETPDGRKLLAHELTHVVQQSRGPVGGRRISPGVTVSENGDSHEQSARASAAAYSKSTGAASFASPAKSLNSLGSFEQSADQIQRDGSDGWAIFGSVAGGLGALFGALALISAVAPTAGGFSAQHASVPFTPAKTPDAEPAAAAPKKPEPPSKSKGKGAEKSQGKESPEPTVPAGPKPILAPGQPNLAPDSTAELNKFKIMEISAPSHWYRWLSLGTTGEDSFAEVFMYLRCDGHNIHRAFTQHEVKRGYSGGILKDDAALNIRANPPQNPVSDPAEVSFNFDGLNNPVGPGMMTFSGIVDVSGAGSAKCTQVSKSGGNGFVTKSPEGFAVISTQDTTAPQKQQTAPPQQAPQKAGGNSPGSLPGGGTKGEAHKIRGPTHRRRTSFGRATLRRNPGRQASVDS